MLKLIEIEAYGCRFRSLLEARWAVFLTNLGVQWEYGVEGYSTECGWFLPDFWLPEVNGGCWLEIKPLTPRAKIACTPGMKEFAKKNLSSFFIAYGLRNPDKDGDVLDRSGLIMAPYDSPMFFCECPICGKIGIQFDGRSARIDNCDTTKATQDWVGSVSHEDKGYTYDSPRIINAYLLANKARFEHVEDPQIPSIKTT